MLDLHAEPYDPRRPVVSFDEKPYPLRAHKNEPLPARPGQALREDYEYVRKGTANLFLFFDLVVYPTEVDLRPWRSGAALAGLAFLLYGFIWEAE